MMRMVSTGRRMNLTTEGTDLIDKSFHVWQYQRDKEDGDD